MSTSTSNVNVAVAHRNGTRHVADQKIKRKQVTACSMRRLWYDFYSTACGWWVKFFTKEFLTFRLTTVTEFLQLYFFFSNLLDYKNTRVITRLKYFEKEIVIWDFQILYNLYKIYNYASNYSLKYFKLFKSYQNF